MNELRVFIRPTATTTTPTTITTSATNNLTFLAWNVTWFLSDIKPKELT